MDAESLIDALAELIADKVAAKLGGTAGGPPAETEPATTDDTPSGKKPSRKRKADPAPEPEEPETEEEDEGETTDLVTEAQQEFVAETAADTAIEECRSELLDFHVDNGSDKDEVSATLADMDEEETRAAYADYLSRIVKEDGDELAFIESFEEPYKAKRIFDGEEKLCWIVGGVTLSDDDVKERKLGDPEKKAPARRTRKAPAKKK
jgi:hypothetical protein